MNLKSAVRIASTSCPNVLCVGVLFERGADVSLAAVFSFADWRIRSFGPHADASNTTPRKTKPLFIVLFIIDVRIRVDRVFFGIKRALFFFGLRRLFGRFPRWLALGVPDL